MLFPFNFYATPDCTTALDEMGKQWNVPSGQALVRLTHAGLDVVEAVQVARDFTPMLPLMYELPDYQVRNRFQYFEDAVKKAGFPAGYELPVGSRKFALVLRDDMVQRMEKAARRENAWRLAERDYARRPASVTIHGVMGWGVYEGLVLAQHRLFPAVKSYQLNKVPISLG